MKKALLIWNRPVDPARQATRCLWKTAPGRYIVTSSVRIGPVAETMAFPSDALGEVTDWCELGVAGYGDHEGALYAAGYERDLGVI